MSIEEVLNLIGTGSAGVTALLVIVCYYQQKRIETLETRLVVVNEELKECLRVSRAAAHRGLRGASTR